MTGWPGEREVCSFRKDDGRDVPKLQMREQALFVTRPSHTALGSQRWLRSMRVAGPKRHCHATPVDALRALNDVVTTLPRDAKCVRWTAGNSGSGHLLDTWFGAQPVGES